MEFEEVAVGKCRLGHNLNPTSVSYLAADQLHKEISEFKIPQFVVK